MSADFDDAYGDCFLDLQGDAVLRGEEWFRVPGERHWRCTACGERIVPEVGECLAGRCEEKRS